MDTRVSRSPADGARDTAVAPIVVGVDARGRSTSAVVWAAEEAERSRRGLRLVTVHEGDPDHQDPQATHGLAALARRLTLVDVSYLAAAGDPTDVLLDEARDASLLVVGRRGLVAAKRLLLGSTALALAGRSPVPVVVVPEPWIQPSLSSAPLVVGVACPDPGSGHRRPAESEDAVLGWACDRARRMRVPLIVVSAWEIPTTYAWSPADVAACRDRHDEALEHLLTPWREQYADLEVVARSVAETPVQALVDASGVSQLVVVGQHLRRRLGRRVVGSTSGGVLDRATRPVAVVPLG